MQNEMHEVDRLIKLVTEWLQPTHPATAENKAYWRCKLRHLQHIKTFQRDMSHWCIDCVDICSDCHKCILSKNPPSLEHPQNTIESLRADRQYCFCKPEQPPPFRYQVTR